MSRSNYLNLNALNYLNQSQDNLRNYLLPFSPSVQDYISGAPQTGFTDNWLAPSNTSQNFSNAIASYNALNQGTETSFWDRLFGSSSNSGTSTGTNQDQIGFGFNMPTLALGIRGLSALGNLWSGFQANKMAQKQYNLAKEAYQTNLANSIKSYNTALTDRIRARAAMETGDRNAYDDYLNENKL